MQRIQLNTVNPRFFTDEELAHYVTLHAAAELPPEWVDELVKRFAALLIAYEDLSLHEPD
jgi:hypothetical protein